MNEEQPAERLSELPHATREFLSELTREDIETIVDGLPIIRMIISFGKVTKWIAITSVGIAVGFVMLSESVGKIIAWFKQP